MGIVQQNMVELDAVVVEALVRSGEAILIDVREEEEFAEERIDGALLIPMSEFTPERLPHEAGKKLILMCLGGVRSAGVGAALLKRGSPASHLKGGLCAWKEAGLPTVEG